MSGEVDTIGLPISRNDTAIDHDVSDSSEHVYLGVLPTS